MTDKFSKIKSFVKVNKIFIGFYLLFIIQGLFWIHLTPIFQAPDEQFHYATVQHYAYQGKYDQIENSKKFDLTKASLFDIETQNLSPELRTLLNYTYFESTRFHPDSNFGDDNNSIDGIFEKKFRQEDENLKSYVQILPAWITNYSPIYYGYLAFFEKAFNFLNLIERFYLLRIFSFLFSLGSVILAYLFFKNLTSSKLKALLLTGLVAFHPMFIFITTSINVDLILIFAFYLLLYVSLKLLNSDKQNLKRSHLLIYLFLIPVSFILGVTAKAPGIFMFFILALLGLMLSLKHKAVLKNLIKNKKNLKYIGGISLGLIGIIILLKKQIIKYLIRYFRNYPLNELLNWEKIKNYLSDFFTYDNLIFNSKHYWGNFGWLDTPINSLYIYFIWFCLLGALIGIAFFYWDFYRFRKTKTNQVKTKKQNLILTKQNLRINSFFILMLLGFNLMIHYINFHLPDVGFQGRYFFPLMIVKFYLIVFGLNYFFLRIIKIQLKQINLITAFLIFIVVLNLISVFFYIIPRFYISENVLSLRECSYSLSCWGDNFLENLSLLYFKVSQYKPVWFKGPVFFIAILVYIISMIFYLKLLFHEKKQTKIDQP
jgi:hypothetical protein